MSRKTHKNGYMSYVECRMLPINAMVLICISQLHFTKATHQSRLVGMSTKLSDIYGIWLSIFSRQKTENLETT